MKKILIVDDSRFSRFQVTKILQEENFEILEAENGAQGLEKVQTHQPDFIISDLLMPEMDGFEFLEKLKQEDNQIPVIVMTADIQDSTRQKVIELGALELINKPLRPPLLLSAIQSALGKKE